MNREFWTKRNVLVTGAGGFKGSHLVEQLAEAGANIVSLVRSFDSGSYFQTRHLDEKSTVVIGDLKDPMKIADILARYSVRTLFHLGAQPIEVTGILNPLETLATNVMGTVHVLEASRLYSRVTEVVVVSSDKAYGPSPCVPTQEKERLHGKTPYDVSKSCADLISQVYASQDVYDMPITVARCANVFGPGDPNMNRIIPGTLEAIIRGHRLQIRSDGTPVREYIYVKDAVAGYIALAEHIGVTRGQAFNLASGHVMSVAQIVERICGLLGKSVEVDILDEVRCEIPHQCLDGSKIKRIIGWEPTTDFADAVRATYEWYLKALSDVRANCRPCRDNR